MLRILSILICIYSVTNTCVNNCLLIARKHLGELVSTENVLSMNFNQTKLHN